MIINERKFLNESPEIFLSSTDLIRVTVGDVGREPGAESGFRSVHQSNSGEYSLKKTPIQIYIKTQYS